MSLPASAYDALELPSETVRILTSTKPSESPAAAAAAAPNLLQQGGDASQPVALNESAITLFAELLLHIRTVTLFASLRTYHTHETKATLSADGCAVTVSHEGESATIRLPIKVKGGGDAALSLPAQPPSKEITLRLQMEEKEGSDLLGTLQSEERKANIVPWGGASLNNIQDVTVLCKSCDGLVVKRGAMKDWRDLPSENWAEMMDFWHCHKPDEHHLHDDSHHEVVAKKGYAAGNRLIATQGVGFVDLASFLLKAEDCEGAKDCPTADGQPENELRCKQCQHVIGANDEVSQGWRIWKWSLSLSFVASPSSSPVTYSIQKWISARLLFLIENSGVRKFHVHPSSQSTPLPSQPLPSLLLWIFTPDLLFSSSIPSPHRHDPTRSIKVFYKSQTWESLKPGESEAASIEDVEFPGVLFEELKNALVEGGSLLPVGARKFQGWNVGLLERFEVEDSIVWGEGRA